MASFITPISFPDTQRCWKCNHPIPKPFQMNSLEMKLARPPMPGDISICAACGAFGVFDELLHVRVPTLEEIRSINGTEELMRMQAEILARL
jgi:hypothetical protein